MKIGAYYVLYFLSPDDPSIQNKIIFVALIWASEGGPGVARGKIWIVGPQISTSNFEDPIAGGRLLWAYIFSYKGGEIMLLWTSTIIGL